MPARSTSWRRETSARRPTSSPSTAGLRSTAARSWSSCAFLGWEHTIARHYLYEAADAERLEQLKASDDEELAGLAAKIDREEVYHRMHAEMWFDRLKDEPRFTAALEELRPLAAAIAEPELRDGHTPELAELWEVMTEVRRSQPAGTTW